VSHFTLTISASGPVVDAAIMVSEARRQVLEQNNIPVPPPQLIRALVDSGASHTCLDPSVMSALGLTPTGTTDVITPTTGVNAVSADTYDVAFAVLAGKPGESHLIFPTWKVSSMELLHAQGIHALIGRDILSRCVLIYNGAENTFTIAY
jgi:hypothetical protein